MEEVEVKRFKGHNETESMYLESFPQKFTYNPADSIRNFVESFAQTYNINETFYIWSNRYNIGKYTIYPDGAVKFRVSPYHPSIIDYIDGLNIMFDKDATPEIRKRPYIIFDYKVRIYNWTTNEKPSEYTDYKLSRFNDISVILDNVSELYNKKHQVPYIWLSTKDKDVMPFGFGIENIKWKGYNVNPWKAVAPDTNKPDEYEPVPHIHYHTTNIPVGYIKYDLNVVFPDYFLGKNDFITLNPYYFQYFPICATPISPVPLPIYVTHKGTLHVVKDIYPDDKYKTVFYKIANALSKKDLPFLFTKNKAPIGHSTDISERSIKHNLYNRVFDEYSTLKLKPDEIPMNAPRISILDKNFKYVHNINALFPEDFKEKNINFLKNFFPGEYNNSDAKGVIANTTTIKNLIYKKPIQEHYNILAGECVYNQLIYEGSISKIANGDMTFADIFEMVPTSLVISMVQWIDDRGRVLYKVYKKHDIPESIFEIWTNKENIKRRQVHSYCVNLYGMLPKMSDAYFVVSFRESGLFTITYDIGKRDIISYVNLYENQKKISALLHSYFGFKLKSYLNNIQVTTQLSLFDEKLNMSNILTIFQKYNNIIFKDLKLEDVNGYKIFGGFIRSDNKEMSFILKIIRESKLIEIFIKDAPSMSDIRRTMHYIRAILMLKSASVPKAAAEAPPTLEAPPEVEAAAPTPEAAPAPEAEAEEEEDIMEKLARTGGIVGGSSGFVLQRLIQADPLIFKTSVTSKTGKNYSRECQKGYQPLKVSNEELIKIDNYYKKQGKGKVGYYHKISYGSDPNHKYNLMCPRYWCEKSGITLTEEDDKCPLGEKERIDVALKPYVYIMKSDKLVIKTEKEDLRFDIPCCGNKPAKAEVKAEEAVKKTIQVGKLSDIREIPKIIYSYIPNKDVSYVTKGTDIGINKYVFVGMDVSIESKDKFMETLAYSSHMKNKRNLLYNIKKILTPSVFLSLENGAVFTAFAEPKSDLGLIDKAQKWINTDKTFVNVFGRDENRFVQLYESYIKYIKYLESNSEKTPYLLFDLMRHLGVFMTIWEYSKDENMAEVFVDLFCPHYRSAESIIKTTKKMAFIGKYTTAGAEDYYNYEAMVIFSRRGVITKKGKEEESSTEEKTMQLGAIVESTEYTEKTYEVLEKIVNEKDNEIIYARMDKTDAFAKLLAKCPKVEGENEVEAFLSKFLAARKKPWEGLLDVNLRLVYVRSVGKSEKWALLPVPVPIGYLSEYINKKYELNRLYYQEEAVLMPDSPTFAPITTVHMPKMIVPNRSKYINELYEEEKNKQQYWYNFQHLFAQWMYLNYDNADFKKARRAKSSEAILNILQKNVGASAPVRAPAVPASADPVVKKWSTMTDPNKIKQSYNTLNKDDKKRLKSFYTKAFEVARFNKNAKRGVGILDKKVLEVGLKEIPINSKSTLLRWIRDHQVSNRYPFFSIEIRETPNEYVFSQGAVEEQVVLPVIFPKKSMNFSGLKKIHAEEIPA